MTQVSILGEKLAVVRVDGVDDFKAPGRPIALVSNIQVEYRPAPQRAPAPRRRWRPEPRAQSPYSNQTAAPSSHAAPTPAP